MGSGAGTGGRWDPPWPQGSDAVGGAYREPPPRAPRAPRPPGAGWPGSEHGPWGDPAGWDAASLPTPGHRPDIPPSMRTATALMYAGAGLTILSALVLFATSDQYADALADASGVRSQAAIDRAVTEAQMREIFQTLLGASLWDLDGGQERRRPEVGPGRDHRPRGDQRGRHPPATKPP